MRILFLLLLGIMLPLASMTSSAAEDLNLPDLNGKYHHLSDYLGKWVVVNYWATWCPPCLEELPELEQFHDTYKDSKGVVLGVNSERISRKQLLSFVDEQFISFPVLRSTPKAGSPLGAVLGLPTTFLISPHGEVVARHAGPTTMSALEKFIADYEQAENEKNTPKQVISRKK